jgi:LacI family transcriptional regulator
VSARRSGGVTLKDVASRAGVSVSAVSQALHGRGANVRVGAATREAIVQAAADLGYVPNANARSLRTNRSHTVGLIFENFGSIGAGPRFYVHLLDAVAREIFARGRRLTLLPHIDHQRPAAMLEDGRLDGVLWCKANEDPCLRDRIAALNIPCVLMSSRLPDESLYGVACDNAAGSALVVQHLLDLGHTKIQFVMERNETETPDAVERWQGFRAACAERGLECEAAEVWGPDARELAAWRTRKPGSTAIYCWNEGLASNALKQCQRLGISVPRELSVVGFDSTEFCEETRPRLTAVQQDIDQMASLAARTLLDLIDGKPAPTRRMLFPVSLDVRDSTGPVHIQEKHPQSRGTL